ncbi:hypothetical protein Blue_039 [Bacillus phage Deep Blue]|uniref:Uncharacterized protein n=1 Tax=Bacillus phage Deep Blue TaxID=1792245 RepID=A0A140HLK0_9CAUD|nr:hypothetical protein Blue_039 [Bacillus phage Deep Blue]AMO25862.1 hypothetical protein Blue_039 [Bacillus phage Deep Blue]
MTTIKKVQATCIHCQVEETVSKDELKGGNWACNVCIGVQRDKRRTYKMLFMDQGVFGAALLEDVPQEEVLTIVNELLSVHKGVLLGLEEVKEKREENKVLH